MLELRPDRNTILIDVENRTCTVLGHGCIVKKWRGQNVISQAECLSIMTIARQAGYTFDTSNAYTTPVFKDFFESLA